MLRIIDLAISTILLISLLAPECLAAGGTIKHKTDGGPDGYIYNALGVEAGRYCSLYVPEDFDTGARICGARIRAIDQSQVTPGMDAYTLFVDLRFEDPLCPGYANLDTVGLIANADPGSMQTCSVTGEPRTATFGGGSGVSDPQQPFLLTALQPANNNNSDPSDFCGLLLDTSSNFVNSSRVQSVRPGGQKESIGENHFLEAFVFEPKDFDLSFRSSGSARFPGDAGLNVMFARRECDRLRPDCRVDPTDTPPATITTDDFMTAHFTIDNNTQVGRPFNLRIIADARSLDPKIGLLDVTRLFRPLGGGQAIVNPILIPPARTIFELEVRTAIKRNFVQRFPIDLPFQVRLEDPNDPQNLADVEQDVLGLRPFAGWYDDGSAEVFVVPRIPVLSGDAVAVRYAALDLPKPGSTLRIDGVQIVGGIFGGQSPGIPFIELRNEDPVHVMNPDLSPAGLFRVVVGPFPLGPPPTTINIDITDFVSNPPSFARAPNVWLLAYLNPGDTPGGFRFGAGMAAIGGDTSEDTEVDDNSFTKPGDGGLPVDADCDTNYMMRADTDPPTGFPLVGRGSGSEDPDEVPPTFALRGLHRYQVYEKPEN